MPSSDKQRAGVTGVILPDGSVGAEDRRVAAGVYALRILPEDVADRRTVYARGRDRTITLSGRPRTRSI